MPPEPLPFDRKDFFKERKPSSSDPAGVVPVRWRETPTTPSSHPNNHGPFSHRCGGAGGSSDFRRPFSGHRRQVGGGWHVTTMEPWQEKFLGDNSSTENNQKDRKTASPNGNSHPHSDLVNSLLPKDQHDKNIGTTGNENSLGSSINWKPIKWIRSGSLSSRGSVDMKIDGVAGNTSPLESPSEDGGVTCLTPRSAADDVSSRKKARLGWGEGLAKYEKKKVGPDDDVTDKEGGPRNGVLDDVSSLEPLMPSPCSQLDKSPSLTGFSECASPATPYSFACSSSPGIEEKASVKTNAVDNDICNISPRQIQGSPFNLENSELTEAANMSSLLTELLHTDDTSTHASGFLKSTAMDKLQLWKADISRTLEITESEIDSLENELKSVVSDVGGLCSLPPPESKDKNTQEEKSGHLSLRAKSSTEKADVSVEEEEHTGVEDLDRESPGTATSKLVEPSTSCDNNTPSDTCILDSRSEDDVNSDSLSTVTVIRNVHYNRDDYDPIFASNKADADEASSVLSNLSSNSQWSTNVPRFTNDSLVKKNFYTRKGFLKFKERVITLKFRAFQYLWKEDLRLLSVRKSGGKSHKKFESSSRMIGFDYQKHRSSIRSRFSFPAGNLSLVPTTEIIEYANKLLSDSQIKIYNNNTLKMPSMILDKNERVNSRFISDNGLVENPCEVEIERSHAKFWTSEEKEIFLEKFSSFGKDFRKIASFLDRKTVADCVEFYYKNHKSERFQKTKKHPEFAKQGKSNPNNMYLLTSGKRWSRESNAASLDILGAASFMAEESQRKSQPKFYTGTSRETAAADVLAGICGSISSEALSSCITSFVDSKRQLSTPDTASHYDVDEETCSDESCGGELAASDWTDEEKSRFINAVRCHGKDFTLISRSMRTKTRDQCKVYYSKARKCLGLDSIHVGNKDVVGPDNGGDGGSDHDDTCMVDSGGSVISCDKSSSELKMDVEDLHSSDSKQELVESDQVVALNNDEKHIDSVEEREGLDGNLEEAVKVEVDLNSVAENQNNCFRDPIVPSHRKTLSQDDISSRLSFRKSGGGFQRSSSTDGYHLHLPKHSLMDCVESSQILRGFPVTVTSNKSTTLKNENLLPEHCLPRDCSLQICTTNVNANANTSEVGKTGDVKLFGQILTKSSSQQPQTKQNGRMSFNLKFDSHSGDESNNNNNNGFGVEKNGPLRRSYGFWDGNRIQTGFPSLPDSSILLAKYPAAFAKFEQQQQLQQQQQGSNNRYNMHQPFTVDKLLLSELPTRNRSSENLPSLQCNGVSDPVAAIRMHYAKTEHYNNGSNGDLGSR